MGETSARVPGRLGSGLPPPPRRARGGGPATDKGAAGRAWDRAGSGSMAEPRRAAVPDAHPGRAAVASAYRRFQPRAYLRNNYAPPRGDLRSPDGVGPWKLRCLAQTFATGERGEPRHGARDVIGEPKGPKRLR